MRLICYLLLTSWCSLRTSGEPSAYVDDKRQLVTEYYADKSSSERQFISSVRKWLLGSGDEKKPKKPQVKYLPVYIPVPWNADMKTPAASDFYGAYQLKPGEGQTIQTPSVATLPYAHSHKYDLPYAGQLHRESVPLDYNWYGYSDQIRKPSEAEILNQRYYQQMVQNPYAYGGYNFPHGISSYAPVPVYYDDDDDDEEDEIQEPEPEPEHDSVVVENPTFDNDTIVKNDEEDYTRNGKKAVKKNRKGHGKRIPGATSALYFI